MTQTNHGKNFPILLLIITSMLVLSVAACNDEADYNSTDTGTEDVSSDEDTFTANLTVTMGVFLREDGEYEDTGRTLTIEVGEPCYSWTRIAQAHPANRLPEATGPHDHYNAADDTSYVDGTVTWTEYGPEHTQEDIDTWCESRTGGVTKSVNDTDYFEDHGGFFLKIIDVE